VSAAPPMPTIAVHPPAWSARPSPTRGVGMSALAMEGTPSLRLPGEHFAAALFFLCAGSIGLIWIAPDLAAGLYLSPHVAGVTHCFTLGWLSMTIFGAMYQLLPVALGVSIRSERAGHVSFWTFAPGVALFASGVAFSSVILRNSGIALIAIGVTCLIVNVALSLRSVVDRDVIWGAIVIALSFLTVTFAMGALLAQNLHDGFLGNWRVTVLATHLHVALLGWVLVMIVGISHRLLPMFLLAHGADTRWTFRALALLASGVLVLALGIVAGHSIRPNIVPWMGLVMIEAGIFCFLRQAWLFFKVRKRPRLDAGLRHAATALVFLAASAVLAPVVLAAGADYRRLDTAYVMLGLLGGLALYVIGQFYKIVPFLTWMVRFREDMGKKRVPTVAQLYSSRVAHIDLVLFITATVGMEMGVITGISLVVRLAACLFVAGAGLFVSQIARVTFGTSFGNMETRIDQPPTAKALS
jgi:hypothetical protein